MESEEHLPILVAHRGYAERYPENSLPGIQAAFAAGADWVEFDVQLSADGVPFLMHDADLRRTAGVHGCSLDLTWQQLQELEIGEASRFGETYKGVQIPSLVEFVQLLIRWPARQAFVELKTESLERFGSDVVIKRVIEVLEPVLPQCVILSFSSDVIPVIRKQMAGNPESLRTGWVIKTWNTASRQLAESIRPDFLFCNYMKIPDREKLWLGPWQWVLYDVETPELALALGKRGAHFVETGSIERLMNIVDRNRGHTID